jgi:hypothetical protein
MGKKLIKGAGFLAPYAVVFIWFVLATALTGTLRTPMQATNGLAVDPEQVIRQSEKLSALADRVAVMEAVKADVKLNRMDESITAIRNTQTLMLSGVLALITDLMIRLLKGRIKEKE